MNSVPTAERRGSRRYHVKLPCFLRRLSANTDNLETLIAAETLTVSRDGFVCVISGDTLLETDSPIECFIELPVFAKGQRTVTICGRGTVLRVSMRDGGGIALAAKVQFNFQSKTRRRQDVAARFQTAAA